MSDDVLWYAARVAGLMAWLLACAALISGLLVRGQSAWLSPAGLWARDAHRFLGLASLAFVVLHGAAASLGELFGITAIAVLVGRDGSGWVEPGLLIGVIAAWLLAVVELGRGFANRLPGAVGIAIEVVAAGTALAGGWHAYSWGSDVRNPLATSIAALTVGLTLAAVYLAIRATEARWHVSTGPRFGVEPDNGQGPDEPLPGRPASIRRPDPVPALQRSRPIDVTPTRPTPDIEGAKTLPPPIINDARNRPGAADRFGAPGRSDRFGPPTPEHRRPGDR